MSVKELADTFRDRFSSRTCGARAAAGEGEFTHLACAAIGCGEDVEVTVEDFDRKINPAAVRGHQTVYRGRIQYRGKRR